MRFFLRKCDSYKKATRQMLEHLQCECTVFPENKKLREVQEAYYKARELGKSEGFIPVFIIPSSTLLEDLIHQDRKPVLKSNLEESGQVIELRWKGSTREQREDLMSKSPSLKIDTLNRLLNFETRAGQLKDEIILAKIPAKHPWEIFASLSIRGGGICPKPKDFMEVSKYWYESYGAVPAVLSASTVEFYIEQPKKENRTIENMDSMWYFWWD